MTTVRPSEYRDALQVSPERIAALNDDDLSDLMRALPNAQAYRCGAAFNEILVNTEGSAKDGGCDGWSPKPERDDDWLGTAPTCWQFKAGKAGEAARLKGEVLKDLPKSTLIACGRFVVVASGSVNGKKGLEDRLKVLREEAEANGIPTARIEVIGSEYLVNWCNQHPAVAAGWAGRPAGLLSLSEWSLDPEHQAQWQATPDALQKVANRRLDLDFATGVVLHMHIQGPPGVGKTRFALELCREAEWRSAVIYIRQSADHRLAELIASACSDKGARLLVVADEVQHQDLLPLRDALAPGEGRVRLITIGHSGTPDPRRIPSLLVVPLGREQMAEVIKGWYPAMPPEFIDFVVRFADGYVRLGRLAADAIAQNPSMDIRGLLELDHIRGFLDRMIGPGDRRSLHVLAVLTKVGWTDDLRQEGEVIARHFQLDWNDVCVRIEDYHRRLGIAPRGGRYRYISPTPLGIYLAAEAWTAYPDLLRSLPEVLPSEEAREAYYERLRSIASSTQAGEFAREQLRFFFSAD